VVRMQRRLVYSVLGDQRQGCEQCGWCCCWWSIEVRPAELERLRGYDWAGESARLRGVELFLEQGGQGRKQSSTYIAQIGGRCAFLEGDNRCLIHRVLGEEAKPAVCRGFPLVLGQTVEGVMVGVNCGCPAVMRNRGERFSQLEGQVLRLLNEADADPEGASGLLGEPIVARPVLKGSTRLSWGAYLELEGSVGEILSMPGQTLTAQAMAARALVRAAAARWEGQVAVVERDEMRGWLEGEGRGGYAAAFAGGGGKGRWLSRARKRGMARRIVRAEAAGSGDGETRGNRMDRMDGGDREDRWDQTDRMGWADGVEGIVRGEGRLWLSVLGGMVDLAAVEAMFGVESPGEGVLTRFLLNYVRGKSLLEAPSVVRGAEEMLSQLYMARWYAAASAVLGGRRCVGEGDVVRGVQAVERGRAIRGGGRSW